MRKVTNFILLLSLFFLQIQAQNPDINILTQINTIENTYGYSRFISNTTTFVAIAAPVTIGTVSLMTTDDDLLKKSLLIGTSLAVSAISTYSIKKIAGRPRPYVTYPDLIIPFEFMRSNSFPSGHTSAAFSTATALTLAYPKWYVAVPGYVWASSVGYSRMNLGVHYPSDVVCGAILGAGSAYLTYKLNEWLWKKKDNKPIIGLGSF